MKKRVISCAVLISLTALCVFASSATRVLFFFAAGVLCAFELYKNLKQDNINISFFLTAVYLSANAFISLFYREITVYAVCLMLAVYAALMLGVFRASCKGTGMMWTLAAIAYPCVPFVCIMYAASSDIWLETLSIACTSTWTCDSFALIGGKRFGKRKIAPEISPNKTLEGCILGALSSLPAGAAVWLIGKAAGGSLFFIFEYEELSMGACLTIAFLSSTLGQIGDLTESLIKRSLGIKDFSNLIPGHGGMFDRADSLMFSIPAAYFLIRAFLG